MSSMVRIRPAPHGASIALKRPQRSTPGAGLVADMGATMQALESYTLTYIATAQRHVHLSCVLRE